jgi:anti-sigma regulatory factor (Ser/Thr protein kinase)
MSTACESTDLTIMQVGSRTEVRMLSHPCLIRPARQALEKFSVQAGMQQEDVDHLGLCFNEATANIMRHGYGGAKDRPILATFERKVQGAEAEVVVTIRDWAKPFDPGQLPWEAAEAKVSGDITDIDKITPGGLGLVCMRRWLDELKYNCLADGMMLTMVKKISHA